MTLDKFMFFFVRADFSIKNGLYGAWCFMPKIGVLLRGRWIGQFEASLGHIGLPEEKKRIQFFPHNFSYVFIGSDETYIPDVNSFLWHRP